MLNFDYSRVAQNHYPLCCVIVNFLEICLARDDAYNLFYPRPCEESVVINPVVPDGIAGQVPAANVIGVNTVKKRAVPFGYEDVLQDYLTRLVNEPGHSVSERSVKVILSGELKAFGILRFEQDDLSTLMTDVLLARLLRQKSNVSGL